MSFVEKRRHERIDSFNLLNFAYIDPSSKELKHGTGRTLNVSESGVLLQTHSPIESKLEISLIIGIEDNLVNIKGEVVRSDVGDGGKYITGIQFKVFDESARAIIQEYIKAFVEFRKTISDI